MTAIYCTGTRIFIQWASVHSPPLQDIEMTLRSCTETHIFIPRISICSCPLQDIEMTTLSCMVTHHHIPRASNNLYVSCFMLYFIQSFFQNIKGARCIFVGTESTCVRQDLFNVNVRSNQDLFPEALGSYLCYVYETIEHFLFYESGNSTLPNRNN